MAHIFTKSGAGGVTVAIPSGVCRVAPLTCETVLGLVSHSLKDRWNCGGQMSVRSRVAEEGSFQPVSPGSVRLERGSLQVSKSLLLHFSTVIIWKWANLTRKT